ncbi:MAG TPA: NUDIX hydrolase [Candidatus Dormibacteraeota bacterium]|jgi:8-oxo-dGTP pyrophosphatase MutT (NUDIX family)|nr:NUDIX hydrolase [Candidatus Dormibacteraeota bacterium]
MSDDRPPRTIISHAPWSGRIMAVRVDRLELPNGAVVEREAVRHPKIAAVVALDEQERVLLVREYRHPAGKTFLQIPSGIREPGEEAASCARRELIEETGYDVRSLEHLAGFYPSPGVSNEFVDLFLGTELVRVGSPQPEGEQGVLEQLRLPLKEAVRRVLSGELLDGKTMVGILLCSHRLAAPGGPRR